MKSIVLKRQVETVEETTLTILSPEIVMFFQWADSIPQPPPVEPPPTPEPEPEPEPVDPGSDPEPTPIEPEPEPIDPKPKDDPKAFEAKEDKAKPTFPPYSKESQGKAEAVMVQYAERLLKKDQVYKLQMAISEDNFIRTRVLSLHIGIFVEEGYEAFYTGEWRDTDIPGVATKYLRVQS